MIDCQPFKAWRYNPDKVKIKNVLAPPYDVISDEEQKSLYQTSPFNCIRLILNQKEALDNESRNIYTRARAFFQEWQKKGVLVQESKPCYYIYGQTFKSPQDGSKKERFALLGRVKTESFEKGLIVPHEKTLKGPREDRMRLLNATQTNFSPIFGLYEDSDRKLAEIIQTGIKKKALFEAKDKNDIQHTLWVIDDSKRLQEIHECFKSRKIYIADGHHRYETALEYARRKKEEQKSDPQKPCDFEYVYMALVSFSDPGFLLLPTHRVLLTLKGLTGKEALVKLGEVFEIEKTSTDVLKKLPESSAKGPMTFGLFLKDEGAFLLRLTDPNKAKKRMPQGKPTIWYELNVSILGYLVLAELLKIGENEWESFLRFKHTAEDAISLVKEGSAQAAFLLKPPPVEMLEKLGKVGERMPQKSTYFYPKIASGLVFYHHET